MPPSLPPDSLTVMPTAEPRSWGALAQEGEPPVMDVPLLDTTEPGVMTLHLLSGLIGIIAAPLIVWMILRMAQGWHNLPHALP
jgi:hypothetical protein